MVLGHPETKGSAKGWIVPAREGRKAHVSITNDNPDAKQWQAIVSVTARGAMARAGFRDLFAGPVEVEIVFFLPRPEGHFGTKGNLLPSARPMPSVKPDLDKLERCLLDGLSGVVYVDDCLVCDSRHKKRYARPGTPEGARVRVCEIPDDECESACLPGADSAT